MIKSWQEATFTTFSVKFAKQELKIFGEFSSLKYHHAANKFCQNIWLEQNCGALGEHWSGICPSKPTHIAVERNGLFYVI